MDENYIEEKLIKTVNEINTKKELIELKSKLIEKFIHETALEAIKQIKLTFERIYHIESFFEFDNNMIIFSIYEQTIFLEDNPKTKVKKFIYKIKVNDFDKVVVYCSNLDPDTDAFRPKDIFGDYEKLDIANLGVKEVVDDFFERYRISELKKLEENYSSN